VSTWFSADLSVGFLAIRKMQSAVIEQQIPDEIGLLEIVTQIVNGMSDEELQAVFRSSIECVQNIIDANRDYTPE
jgi:hypothetical protein